MTENREAKEQVCEKELQMPGWEERTQEAERQTREMVCICCPLGCSLTVTRQADGSVSVTGNTCPRGAQYGEKELINPMRVVTSTVRAAGRENLVVPVKTVSDIPKGKIMDCMRELAAAEVKLPAHIGDIVLKNVAGTGVDVTVTGNVEG